MGREINKRTYEYHNPVHMNKIPSGGFMYCNWYGRVGRTNKWAYSVADPKKYQTYQIKGVLKDPLKVMTVPKADRKKYEKDEPPADAAKHGRPEYMGGAASESTRTTPFSNRKK
jgi:hypothetical protein